MTRAISDAALTALRAAVVDGAHVRLTGGQLPRPVYAEVNDVLVRLGGKWKGGKTMAHVFTDDPSAALATVLDEGEKPAKNPEAFFPTPAPVIARMLDALALESAPDGLLALEPSAGDGAVARALRAVRPDAVIDLCEIHPQRKNALVRERSAIRQPGDAWSRNGAEYPTWPTVCGDFLHFAPLVRYDRIVMNPPFTAPDDPLAYTTHIYHAYDLLAVDGILAAITPAGVTFRQDPRVSEFREWAERRGRVVSLGAQAFKESGTGVGTCMLVLRASEAA